MKKSWKRVLSAVLTLVMIAGLLVVPAAAEDLTGAVNDSWVFKDSPDFTEAAYAYANNSSG